jgi:tellurium resistance protein TerZ
MGLHWDPPREGDGAEPENLDALCVMMDAAGGVIEVVHPGHPRNENGSVLHTGDSRTGASEWDDERIFVFLNALPGAVVRLAFWVASASGRPLGRVRGAHCHVSDHASERSWVRREFGDLQERAVHCVAVVRRSGDGWTISSRPEDAAGTAPDEVLTLAGATGGKRSTQ